MAVRCSIRKTKEGKKRSEERSVIEDDVSSLTIRLVGSHPLWAHHLWNASKVFASFFDKNKEICRDKCVLELGAGGALPSLVAALNGARKVVVTDYPDSELIDNIRQNVSTNLKQNHQDRVSVQVRTVLLLASISSDPCK